MAEAMSDGITDAMRAAASAAITRVATCHERVACPTCRARVGERCTNVSRRPTQHGKPLKHSHDARLRADGIALR